MKQEAEFTGQAKLTVTQVILKTHSDRFHKIQQLEGREEIRWKTVLRMNS